MGTDYVLLHSSLLNHWVWSEKTFSKGQAFIDLVLLSFSDPCERDVPKLAKRWGWNEKAVEKFLDSIESDSTLIEKVKK